MRFLKKQIGSQELYFKGLITWTTVEGTGFGGMYLYLADIPEGYDYQTPIKTDEGILDWKEINWILHPENLGVASNIPSCLEKVLYDDSYYNHHSIFKDGKMIDQISTTIDPRLEDDEVLRNEYLNGYLKGYQGNQKYFTIECEDIILREYRIEDLDELYNLTQQPEIMEFLPDWNVPKEQRLHWLKNYEIVENKQFLKAVSESGTIEQLRLRLGIISKESGEFIGWCCTGIKEELPHPNREIMFAISRSHTRKGYTTQATLGIIDYLFENTDVEALNAVALTHNIPSNRVIQKCGFDLQDMIEIDNDKYNHYKLLKG